MSGRRIAILGGVFDPIHIGHTAVLEQVVDALGAAEGWLMPSRRHALRTNDPQASDAERLLLARAAASTHPRLRVDDIELGLPAPTRTLLTQRALAVARPGLDLWWVLGADQARNLPRWYGAQALLAQASFVLVNRTGSAPISLVQARRLGFDPGRTRLLEIRSPPVSSTAIRALLLAGAPAAQLADPQLGPLEPAVAQLIAERGLYLPSATLPPWNPPASLS